jgi:hypothetical protein
MAHFALLDGENVVQTVIVMPDELDGDEEAVSRRVSSPCRQTSYNTRGGVYHDPLTGLRSARKMPLRKNYAGIGYIFDEVRNAFIPPRPPGPCSLNEVTGQWEMAEPATNDKTVT